MLARLAPYGRFFLFGSLIVGVAAPGLAEVLEPWVPHLVALLLFLNAFRSGAKIRDGLADAPWRGVWVVLGLQVALPLTLLVILKLFYAELPAFWFAAILMLSAPSLSGTPNFVAMSGLDPSGAMRLLITGTFLFPATALVALWALPGVDSGQAFVATAQLAAVILGVVACGVLLRLGVDRRIKAPQLDQSCDGALALLLSLVVVGLMVDVGPLLRSDPLALVLWIAAVLALNLVLQIGALFFFRSVNYSEAVAASTIAGNRNTALVLIVLPQDIAALVMLFVGCYQIPMYLTPLLMRRFHLAGQSSK